MQRNIFTEFFSYLFTHKIHGYISFIIHYRNAFILLITRIIGIQDCLHVTTCFRDDAPRFDEGLTDDSNTCVCVYACVCVCMCVCVCTPLPSPFFFFFFFCTSTTSYALKSSYALRLVFPTPRPIRLTLVIHTGEYYGSCSFFNRTAD